MCQNEGFDDLQNVAVLDHVQARAGLDMHIIDGSAKS